jgi:hypothetical protein
MEIRSDYRLKRLALILISALLILLAACDKEDASDIPSDTEAAEKLADIPADIEVAYSVADKIIYEDLEQVEEDATVIVEAVAKKTLGQKVSTHYDYELKKDLPGSGYTKWEIEVTKVYKGDVKEEDKLVLLQDYYIWTYSDGKDQLVSTTALKPAVKNREYLMFLKYDDINEGYWPVCDYEGMFTIPNDELKEKVKDGMLEQTDLEVYNYETLFYLVPIYKEVVQKYFN